MDLSERTCARIFLVYLIVLLISETRTLPVDRNKEALKNAVDNIIIQEKSGKLNLTFNESDNKNAIDQIAVNANVQFDNEQELQTADGVDEKIVDLGNVFIDEEEVQKDGGMELEEPTARIVVSVMKRSGRYWEPWELNHNVCPPSLCTQNDEISRPRGTGDSVFYNGDIVLDKDSERIIYPNGFRQRWKRATMKSSKTWKHGVVPYVFADDIASKSKSVIRKAMKEIENKTCITFRRRKLRDDDYIRFISEPGCWSSVGRVGGEQKISIGRGCERIGTAIHEISHTLGFWHEQARPDRDKYVEILKDNISPRYLADFNITSKELVTSRGFPYDYESVMHYSEKAFTNIGEPTIKIIGVGKRLNMKIGQRDELSNIDIAQLRDMYKCNDKEDDNETLCPDSWVKYGRSCYKFEDKKKEQFSGAAKACQDMNSKLLQIDDSKEDSFVKKMAKKKFPEVKTWRTGGRLVNDTFVWFNGADSKPTSMDYTKWQKGHPGAYSSMALVFNRQKDRIRWQGVWLGSYSQLPDHAYPYICERRARRKCIPGQFSDGRDYRGNLDHTIDGVTCQKWSSQYPHSHKLLPYPYTDTEEDNDGLGDHNYCRNPSGTRRSRPWCYTTKSKLTWQYCDVSICSKKLQSKPNGNSDRKNNSQKKNSSNRRPTVDNRTERMLADSAVDTPKTENGDKDRANKKQNQHKGSSNKQNGGRRGTQSTIEVNNQGKENARNSNKDTDKVTSDNRDRTSNNNKNNSSQGNERTGKSYSGKNGNDKGNQNTKADKKGKKERKEENEGSRRRHQPKRERRQKNNGSDRANKSGKG